MEAQKQYFIDNGYEDILRDAIEYSFKVENWPYVQDEGELELRRVKGCFESMSRHSWINIMLGS